MSKLHFTSKMIQACLWAVLLVLALTVTMLFIGRSTLGEAVIALLYLLPISWSTTRWGQGPGVCAAFIASLCFDFFFIPPFYTFTIGRLEGWSVLIIFLLVAVAIIGRIQYGLSQAQAREREAVFMYELSSALARLDRRDEIARTLARQLQQIYQAALVQVILPAAGSDRSIVASVPSNVPAQGKPDRTVPILAAQTLIGEMCLWRGEIPLPSSEDRLLQNFAHQSALALERTQLVTAAT